jgi:dipeptidyl aminopeptidase/acylaminoacyl peptidase
VLVLPADLDHLLTVAQPVVSPDGRRVAFTLLRADPDGNGYRSQVWVADIGGAPPMPFTSGEHRDGSPCWSPDGARLAFASDRGTDDSMKTTLHVAPVSTAGEVVTIGRFKESVRSLRWSPDGRLIAFVTRTRDGRYDEEDDGKRGPQRVRRLYSRLDNEGPIGDRPAHVYVVAADGASPPRNLTPGEFEFADPAWSPDSRSLVVSGAAHDTWDLDNRQDLHVLDVVTGGRRVLTDTTGVFHSPEVSPDGGRVCFLGTEDPDSYPRNDHVAVRELDDEQVHEWVSRELDRTWSPFPAVGTPRWLDDTTLLAAAEDRGDVRLYALSADGRSAPRALTAEGGCVTGYHSAGGTVAFTLTTETSPGELYVVDDDGPRALTSISDGFARQAELRRSEHFVVRSSDGAVDLDAWLLRPAGFVEDGSYPLLLNVHGGPFTQYGNRFFDEVQMQARAGYAVLWCNPRGSSGREEDFGRAICGPALGGTGWGSVDYDDVMTVLDAALDHFGFVDAERLGILGGSYGGYLTSWAVTHTDRFRAACSERAANNLLSLEWASDAAGAFRTFFGVSHLDDPDLYLRHSPVSYVRDCVTPLLIVHSEGDLRCPVEQADQLFVALRLLERDVEMVRFTGESHELSRSGTPAHRRQRMQIILDFFGRHLCPADPATATSAVPTS